MQDEATVICPHCGEAVDITLDWGGGHVQDYVEDCQVCCRPWNVHVIFDDEGRARVQIEPGE